MEKVYTMRWPGLHRMSRFTIKPRMCVCARSVNILQAGAKGLATNAPFQQALPLLLRLPGLPQLLHKMSSLRTPHPTPPTGSPCPPLTEPCRMCSEATHNQSVQDMLGAHNQPSAARRAQCPPRTKARC